MRALGTYAILLLVPLTCAPIQVLYLKYGRRFDLGAVTYIAYGAFAAASWFPSADHQIIINMAWSMGFAAVTVFAIRGVALAFGRPAEFTLISFGQLWATPALIDYKLQSLTSASGLQLEDAPDRLLYVLSAACVVAALVSILIRQYHLDSRLVALTEAPVQYRLLFGSRYWLAFRLEFLAFITYFVAGILLCLITNNLSADSFGDESLWCVLAAAPSIPFSGILIILGPFGTMILRFVVKSVVPSWLASPVVYIFLALLLAGVAATSKEASRDATP